MLRTTSSRFAVVNRSFRNAAAILGAGEWRIFWRVTLPLAWPALTAAVLVGFARAFADFIVTAVFATNAGAGWLLSAALLALAALYGGSRVAAAQVPA